MAIQILKTPPGGGADAGLFNLPPTFDRLKHAAEWVEEGQVAMKEQRQILPQANMTADGWTIWKEKEGGEPTKVRVSGGRTFVLMCRPAAIQAEVNAIFGDVSKRVLKREIQGETVDGASIQDSGILTEERLRRELGGDMSSGGGDVTLNRPLKAQQFEQISAAQET